MIEHIEITPAISKGLARLRTTRKDDLPVCVPEPLWNALYAADFKAEWSKLTGKALELKKIERGHVYSLRAYYVTWHKAKRGMLPNLHAN
ncbi:hypothetical protein [Mycetohabitans sp. B46]|uniref:hypothetical protein n=1 Tax=Mycetohabitans sp. B46 TaxID=2772536 RepID=UPI00307DA73B